MSFISQSKPLTVAAAAELLRQLVEQGQGERTLNIPFDSGIFTVGGHPTVHVTALEKGSEWDPTKVFMWPSQPLGAAGAEFKQLKADLDMRNDQVHRAQTILQSPNSALDKVTELKQLLFKRQTPARALLPRGTLIGWRDRKATVLLDQGHRLVVLHEGVKEFWEWTSEGVDCVVLSRPQPKDKQAVEPQPLL